MQHLYNASDYNKIINHIRDGFGGVDGVVIRETKQIELEFSSCIFSHEVRAHNLARLGVTPPQSRHIWLGDPHDILLIPVNIHIH